MRNPVVVLRLLSRIVRLTFDLRRLDQVIAINELLLKLASAGDLEPLLLEVRNTPHGADALRLRRRLGPLHVHALSAMPSDTLGGAYGRFMLQRGLSPANLPTLRASQDIEYVLAHIYETHDLWHVLTGFDTDTNGA